MGRLPQNPRRTNYPRCSPAYGAAQPAPQRPAPPPEPAPARRQAIADGGGDGLVLVIRGTAYQVVPVPREPGDEASVVVRLVKSDGEAHTVARLDGWCECDCGAYLFDRRDWQHCKHIDRLARWGLLGPRPPVPPGIVPETDAQGFGMDAEVYDQHADGDPFDVPQSLVVARQLAAEGAL